MRKVLTTEEIGKRIKICREGLRIDDLQDAAELAKVDRSSYGQYEAGNVEPKATTIAKIAVAFNTSVDSLVIEDNAKTPTTAKTLNLEQCNDLLLELDELCEGASRSPIEIFAAHLAGLRDMVKQVGAEPALAEVKLPPKKLTAPKVAKLLKRKSAGDSGSQRRVAGEPGEEYGEK